MKKSLSTFETFYTEKTFCFRGVQELLILDMLKEQLGIKFLDMKPF